MATYTITVTKTPISGAGTVKVGSSTASGIIQEEGTDVNILASPASGYFFVSWEIDSVVVSTSSSYTFVMPSNNIILTSNFGTVPTPTIEEQSEIYDTDCPRFLFINNLSERYFAGDLVNLAVTDYVEVVEPINFDSGVFKLERDSKYHGFNYDFSVDELQYEIGTTGYSFLKNKLSTTGTDSDVKFVYGFGDIDSLTIFYIGKVDFNEYREVDNGEKISFSLVELDFDNLLQTAFEVPQEVVPTIDVLLHSKVIPKTVTYRLEKDNDISNVSTAFIEPKLFDSLIPNYPNKNVITNTTPIGAMYTEAYLFFNSGREGNDEFLDFVTYDLHVTNNDILSIYGDNKYVMRATEAGVYDISIRTTFGLNFQVPSVFSDPYPFQLVVAVTEDDGVTIVSEDIYEADDVYSLGSVLASADVFLTFNRQLSLDIDIRQCLYIYIKIPVSTPRFPAITPFTVFPAITSIINLPYKFDYEAPSIEIIGQTYTDNSKALCIDSFTALNEVFKKSAEKTYDVVDSSFFSGGCGENLLLCNGFSIRGGTSLTGISSDKINIRVAPKQLFDMLSAIFNLGWGVEYNELKEELIKIETADYFYQDVEILALDSVTNYTKEIDTSQYYNQIEVGFSKYSKGRETDKGNTLDDFHTKHLYQTPIKTNKNKLSIVSDLIMSAYEIEILRRKQFIKDGSTDKSNFSEDESIFGIYVRGLTPFTGGTYSDVLETQYSTYLYGSRDVYRENSTITYTSRNGVVQTRVVKTHALLSIGSVVEFYEPLQGGAGTGDVTLVVAGTTYIEPETDDAFGTVTSLVSPKTSYNLRFTPKRILQNWAYLINGGFFGKSATDTLVFKQGDGNIDLSTTYAEGVTCRFGDVSGDTVTENADIIIGNNSSVVASMQEGRYLFVPIKVSFETDLTFEQLTDLKKCLRGQDGIRDYGYLTINNPCGGTEQIYVTSIEHNPTKDYAKIEGYLKQLN